MELKELLEMIAYQTKVELLCESWDPIGEYDDTESIPDEYLDRVVSQILANDDVIQIVLFNL